MLRLALLVQRYGLEVNGGAELHCRLVAEHLAKDHKVEVLTSRALDYISWQDHYPSGQQEMNGVLVRRFGVGQIRDERRFGLISHEVFSGPSPESKQLVWLREQGPYLPDLIRFLKEHNEDYDVLIPFSFRYYHSYECVRHFPNKSVLVPTAEPDPAVNLSIFRSTFNGARAILYNTPESQALIQEAHHNYSVPGIVTGVGIEENSLKDIAGTDAILAKHSLLRQPYIIYIGRIDNNKGCDRLFKYFTRFIAEQGESDIKPVLVLLGNNIIPIPDHPMIRHLGFVPLSEKQALLRNALLLVMPSFLESLSMVLLEAWAHKRPVLANGLSDVLRGQCLRSNGGLYYRSEEEFLVCLQELLKDEFLRKRLGSLGNKYFRLNYSWRTIESKYERAFEIALGEAESGRAASA